MDSRAALGPQAILWPQRLSNIALRATPRCAEASAGPTGLKASGDGVYFATPPARPDRSEPWRAALAASGGFARQPAGRARSYRGRSKRCAGSGAGCGPKRGATVARRRNVTGLRGLLVPLVFC